MSYNFDFLHVNKPHIIIVTGYLAAGKSTFARRLSEAVNIPCIIKDTFKIALCESISLISKEESSRFSAVTFNGMMYVTERLMEAGQSLIIEGNFTPAGLFSRVFHPSGRYRLICPLRLRAIYRET